MDQLVDQAMAPRSLDKVRAPSTHDAAPEYERDSEDIESELYSSTREAGISAIAYSFLADDASD
jgi:hypothetical protein